jgi:hypothetical protein
MGTYNSFEDQYNSFLDQLIAVWVPVLREALNDSPDRADTVQASVISDPLEPTETVAEIASSALTVAQTREGRHINNPKGIRNLEAFPLTLDEVATLKDVNAYVASIVKEHYAARKSWLRNVTSGDCISVSLRVRNMLRKTHPTTFDMICKFYNVDTANALFIGKSEGRNCYSADPLVNEAIHIAIAQRLCETRAHKFTKGEWVLVSNEQSVESFLKRIHTSPAFTSPAHRNAAKRLFSRIVRGDTYPIPGCFRFFDAELGIVFRPTQLIKWLAASV